MTSARNVQTLHSADWVYGPEGSPPLDDPVETFHELSKAYPSFLGRQVAGAAALASVRELQLSATRATKRHLARPSVALAEPKLPATPFREVLACRRSRRELGDSPLPLDSLSALLHAGYGVTGDLKTDAPPVPLRTVPSGGALYPLDVNVAALNVDGLAAGMYHFDPLRHVLEHLGLGDPRAPLVDASTYPDIVGSAGAVLLLTAMFWRSRFKYGPRAYRFTLLEAGHLAQNVLLAAEALSLAAVPLGGFYDRQLDELLGIDGVNESTLYLVAVGAPAAVRS